MPTGFRIVIGILRELRIFQYAMIVALALMMRSILIDITEIAIEVEKVVR